MEKPIVFFSHSSKDETILKNLKNFINNKTGEAIEIFLSSDGQSIPFGKNWVHKIEESLNEASLMFVFISPNSLNSNWIHFEVGYSYSKKIRVIPVGILGIDLNQIKPPLSLLQGFNLNKNDAIGNLLAIINETYDTKFNILVTEEDFKNIINITSYSTTPSIIYSLNFSLTTEENLNIFEELINFLDQNEIDYIRSDDTIISSSFQITGRNSTEITVYLDGLHLKESLDILYDFYVYMGEEKFTSFIIIVYLNENYTVIDHLNKQIAILSDTQITAGDKNTLIFEDIKFVSYKSLGNNYIRIFCKNKMIDYNWVDSVIGTLYEKNIISDYDLG